MAAYKWLSGISIACLSAAGPAHGAQLQEAARAQAADPLATLVKASKWIETGDGRMFVELILDPRNAGLRFRSDTKATPEILILRSPREALYLLADRRFEFMWAPLTTWAGPDLSFMRDRLLAKYRAAAAQEAAGFAPGDTSESSVRPHIRAMLQLATYLDDIGRSAEAEQLLRSHLATMRPAKNKSWRAIEYSSVASRAASIRAGQQDYPGGIALYEHVERVLGKSPYAVNATISRASLLAGSGRYAEALAAVDAAWARWSRENSGDKIPGSERQFARVRACALNGLGRRSEAEAAFRPILQNREWTDPTFVIASDSSLAFSGRVCMKDSNAIAEMLLDELRSGATSQAVLLFQPAYQPPRDREFWDAVRAHPRLKASVAERLRLLPPPLHPALNWWRPTSPPPK